MDELEDGLARRTMLQLLGGVGGAAGVTAALGAGAVAAAAPDRRLPDSAATAPPTAPAMEQLRGDQPVFSANSAGRGVMVAAIDEWVFNAQQWVNSTYGSHPGFVPAPETGRTGWSTMFALTRALQIELGLSGSQLSDSFGPTTLSLLTSQFGDIDMDAPPNVVRIVQSALYCKGYPGEQISGTYGPGTGFSVMTMRNNMGFSDDRTTLAPKEFKALLTMDAYVVVENGSTTVRSVQQWMNREFYSEPWFFIIPCDGHSSRDVQKAHIWALQIEMGVAGANGNYGPGTRAAVQAMPVLTVGAGDGISAKIVHLFQAGLIFNRYEVVFDGIFTLDVENQVRSFQQFVALPVTGKGDYQTWSSLLVSNGDPDRRGAACDCVTEVTPARAASLAQAHDQVVGRYLSNVPGSSLDKKIKPGELAIIFAAGLRVFPIYQTFGGQADYFTEQQGCPRCEPCDGRSRRVRLRTRHHHILRGRLRRAGCGHH